MKFINFDNTYINCAYIITIAPQAGNKIKIFIDNYSQDGEYGMNEYLSERFDTEQERDERLQKLLQEVANK